jgi:hypothetical protein
MAFEEETGDVDLSGTEDKARPAVRALVSIAFSLKRIADALDGTTMGVDISESLAGLGRR